MSIADKITRLGAAKTNIATAISDKGGSVATDSGFEEFAAAIATIPSGGDIPEALPNPYPLTLTGAVTASYDGSEEVSVEIPRGSDGITPTIGDNGNWYLGDTDTGKPSRGPVGPMGTNADVYGFEIVDSDKIQTSDFIKCSANLVLYANFVDDLTTVDHIDLYDSTKKTIGALSGYRRSGSYIYFNNDATAAYCKITFKMRSGEISEDVANKAYITKELPYDEYLDANVSEVMLPNYVNLFNITGGISKTVDGQTITALFRNGKVRIAKSNSNGATYYLAIDNNRKLSIVSTTDIQVDAPSITDFVVGKTYCSINNIFYKNDIAKTAGNTGTVTLRNKNTIIGSATYSPFVIKQGNIPNRLLISVDAASPSGSVVYCRYDVYESDHQIPAFKFNEYMVQDLYWHRLILNLPETVFTDNFAGMTVPSERNAQSMCIAGHYAYCFIRPSSSDEDPILIRKIDLNTKTVVATSNNIVVGHANSCYYDAQNNNIVVCSIDPSGMVTRIDPDTLEMVSKHYLAEKFESVLGEGKFAGLGSVFYSEGSNLVYMRPRNGNERWGFFCFTPDFEYLGVSFTPNSDKLSLSSQGGFIYHDKYYVFMIDSNTHQNHLISYSKYGDMIYDEKITGNYEIEDAKIYNGKLIALCCGWTQPREITLQAFHMCEYPINKLKLDSAMKL